MALITLTDRFAVMDDEAKDWPGDFLSADTGVSFPIQTDRKLVLTFGPDLHWPGYSVTLTGSHFGYHDGALTEGTLSGVKITDEAGHTVLRVSGIAGGSVAADIGAFMAYTVGFADGDSFTFAQPRNAWSLILSGDDTIKGTAGDDQSVVPGQMGGNDVYDMGAGDDFIAGGLGSDTVHGGDGWDILSYQNTSWSGGAMLVRGITVDVDAGTVADPYGAVDSFDGIEELHGTLTADRFIGGAEGKDFYGLRGSDTFIGGSSPDDFVIYDDDFDNGGHLGIIARLGTGLDGTDITGTIRDGFGCLDHTVNIANVMGTADDDIFIGNAMDNFFAGYEGKDRFVGGEGRDRVTFAYWLGNVDSHGIIVNLARDKGQIVDDGFGNTETARSIEDIIGSNANDRIYGNLSDNMFRGGEGDDTMRGGGGHDTFRWRDRGDVSGGDKVLDFHAGAGAEQDLLSFGMSDDGLSTTLHLVIGTTAAAQEETFLFNPLTHVLSFDVDGTGSAAAVDIVWLKGVSTLSAENFDLY